VAEEEKFHEGEVKQKGGRFEQKDAKAAKGRKAGAGLFGKLCLLVLETPTTLAGLFVLGTGMLYRLPDAGRFCGSQKFYKQGIKLAGI
jgi:hypothetical protein